MRNKDLDIANLIMMLEWTLEWIDAVPANTILPAMPGFQRDFVNDTILEIKHAK